MHESDLRSDGDRADLQRAKVGGGHRNRVGLWLTMEESHRWRDLEMMGVEI